MTADSRLPRRSLLLAAPAAALAALVPTGPAGARVGVTAGAVKGSGASADPAQLGAGGGGLDPAPASLHNPTLLVAGPADAGPGLWARLLAPRLGDALQTGSTIAVSATGGRDGVTGANAFEALTTPDGSTAMLVPGAAAIAWLAGDPRVHFDAGRWVPALAGLCSGVLVGRFPGGDPLAGRRIAIAASTATGPELPALLGLSMLSAVPLPTFGLSEPQDAASALRAGHVDAVFLTGHDVPQRLRQLTDVGFVPLFSLGGSDDDIEARDPAIPAVPTFAELFGQQTGHAPAGPLFAAWRATAAAARLDVALVLPLLAPPSLVARWRSACQSAVGDLGLVSAARTAQSTRFRRRRASRRSPGSAPTRPRS
ncbi:hypothetical protein [Lichenicola sp.]|uniref:hypothetical protein n=1 Tax=Lichenicola sp. TaxID=2804529 RepID=UPI003B000575